eukprot:CAMPEP_0177395990 /NCGR_PEP_ID=MMETSP0368-20130122/56459_1 /TAXON_ID=447022 ORGANISM="Scrippsiella hangoei-like, Strain SHHI-4" /NCGR_SAMPLE_ID=MMETSP0368 /ASSEMBLY_ACC=CAM_ASM_000363 /LENGTH=84 /DNA_ID=CAMNT_0018862637 /DNA_START=1 /DNA_END=255 /DNA_ORIENTATION=+
MAKRSGMDVKKKVHARRIVEKKQVESESSDSGDAFQIGIDAPCRRFPPLDVEGSGSANALGICRMCSMLCESGDACARVQEEEL